MAVTLTLSKIEVKVGEEMDYNSLNAQLGTTYCNIAHKFSECLGLVYKVIKFED